jgi:phenylpropionate dioxygenase-like ring-hydroxylating dioxygenase large terminal subunit
MNDPVLMNEWLAAGWSTSIRQGELKAQQVLGREIVLWRSSTGIHAWEACAFIGAPGFPWAR